MRTAAYPSPSVSPEEAAAAAPPPEPYALSEVLEGGVGVLTLNRPRQRNPLSSAMIETLHAQLQAWEADRTVRVVVLRAKGPVFSAGHDLKEVRALPSAAEAEALLTRCTKMMEAFRLSNLPVIAQVHALASAAGCQLVASCDLVIASSAAGFQTPGVNLGLFCSTPMIPISRAMHPRKTMEMLLTGTPVSAEVAERHGLVNQVVPPADLEATTLALARQIAQRSAFTVGLGKQAYYRQLPLDMAGAYQVGQAAMVRNLAAQDAQEGIRAFIEKREPHWQDC